MSTSWTGLRIRRCLHCSRGTCLISYQDSFLTSLKRTRNQCIHNCHNWRHGSVFLSAAGLVLWVIHSNNRSLWQLTHSYEVSNRNWTLTGILLLFILVQFVLTTIYCVRLVQTSLIKDLAKFIHFEIIMNSSAVFADLPLALSMIWLLRKNRSGIKRTDSIISRLVRLTIGSGLATGLWAIVAVIAASASPHSLIYVAIDLIFPKREMIFLDCLNFVW